MSRPPLLVFSDDWGRHPSSSQHLVARLLDERPVLWVNTIGTRPLRLDLATLRRAAGKLAAWSRPAAASAGRAAVRIDAAPPTVLNPRMWPSFERPLYRRMNRALVSKTVRDGLRRFDAPPDVLTTLPITADLVGGFPARSWTYYAVDDFSSWPGYFGETLGAMERELVPKVDLVVAASREIQRALSPRSRRIELLTHGIDAGAWRIPRAEAPPIELAGLEAPYVLFWGLVDRRMDPAWLEALGRAMTRGTIVLVGPHDAPDPRLASLPRVVATGPVAHARLAHLATAASALIMPYADLPATRAMQPLKLLEYLATGVPTFVRRLPSTEPWTDHARVCDDVDDFVSSVLAALSGPAPRPSEALEARLREESWSGKSTRLAQWIDAIGRAAPPPGAGRSGPAAAREATRVLPDEVAR